jgi:hypothetical protein
LLLLCFSVYFVASASASAADGDGDGDGDGVKFLP